jgi:hypothetical protein
MNMDPSMTHHSTAGRKGGRKRGPSKRRQGFTVCGRFARNRLAWEQREPWAETLKPGLHVTRFAIHGCDSTVTAYYHCPTGLRLESYLSATLRLAGEAKHLAPGELLIFEDKTS